jgi:hypothetical protein
MIVTRTIYEKAVDFKFSARYKGQKTNFIVTPSSDRFTILTDGKPFGEIKIGYDRHTWYVLDSNFVAYELVKEIGQIIVARFY